LDLAENCIRNNHLIAGALPLFLAGTLFPWHVDAAAWRHRGRQVLIEAIQEQWWNDGGYVQPSHTYHRLALSYLLWAARVAELHGDHEFVGKAKTQLRNGGALLYQMTDCSTGTLPNWGPNDGALFPPLGGSDYSDFRPILNAVGYATEGCRVFPEGPGDELMVWLWGMNALSAPERPPIQRSHSFPHAGLHILRSSEAHAVLRCGPVLSRYGQHADQLHVDVWWRGRNFLRDNGSYSYADPRFHEWFRSTDAHNTVVCDGRSQMEPHRQFLFLKWPSSRMLEMTEPPPGVLDWVGGLHTGYHRLDRVVTHTRILARLESARWLVVDKVSAALDGRPIPVDLRWHLIQGAIRLTDSEAKVMLDDGPYGLRWCATEETVASISEGSDSPVDGWASRYYGLKAPAPSLRIRARLDRAPLVMATLLGPSLEKHELILSEGKLTAGQVCLDLSDLLNSAP
jgi:asparagine synthase (glutamine-hydrolysing)